jgi:hypothetical protein
MSWSYILKHEIRKRTNSCWFYLRGHFFKKNFFITKVSAMWSTWGFVNMVCNEKYCVVRWYQKIRCLFLCKLVTYIRTFVATCNMFHISAVHLVTSEGSVTSFVRSTDYFFNIKSVSSTCHVAYNSVILAEQCRICHATCSACLDFVSTPVSFRLNSVSHWWLYIHKWNALYLCRKCKCGEHITYNFSLVFFKFMRQSKFYEWTL